MKSILEFFEAAKKMAVCRFNRTGVHTPVFLFEARDGVLMIPALWQNQREKEVAVLAAKHVAKKAGATRVVVIFEGWMVTRPAGSSTEGLVPSKEPDRTEVLWIVAQTSVAGENGCGGFFDIARDAGGKPSLGEFKPFEETASASIFDGIVGRGLLQ